MSPYFLFVVVCLAAKLDMFLSLPVLNIDGFAWAENLVFDGIGGLFVSESVRGELWRISLNPVTGNYTSAIHVTKGFKQFGGLSATENGQIIYAAVVFEDKSNGIIAISTKPSVVEQSYQIVTHNMAELANGMALVPSENALYCTAETGTLSKVELSSGKETIVSDKLDKPDGLWFDVPSSTLIIGELLSKRINTYNTLTSTFTSFPGASSLSSLHMLDDLTLVNGLDSKDISKSVLVAADWTGKQILRLTLDGTVLSTVPLPVGVTSLYEPTSIRRGRGPGFDPRSFYITEGGGLTRNVNNRRVIQLDVGAIV
jgi:hypothetical protein